MLCFGARARALSVHRFTCNVSGKKAEKDILIELVDRCKNILECKQTDVSSTTKKNEAWRTIAERYNSNYGVTFRDNEQLKKGWTNLTQEWKEEKGEQRRERFKTGEWSFRQRLCVTKKMFGAQAGLLFYIRFLNYVSLHGSWLEEQLDWDLSGFRRSRLRQYCDFQHYVPLQSKREKKEKKENTSQPSALQPSEKLLLSHELAIPPRPSSLHGNHSLYFLCPVLITALRCMAYDMACSIGHLLSIALVT